VLDISLPFEIEAGGPIGGFDPKRFGITEDVLAAPTFYPLVPLRVDGAWQVETAPPGGDTTNSDTAYYQVDLTVPQELALAASGVAVGSTVNGDGTVTTRYLTGPMRDFAFALGPFQSSEAIVDGVLVRAWALPEHSQDADEMLDAATTQLGILNDLVGPYPYVELDVVDVPGAFGGIEYPGIVFIGTLGTTWLVEPTVHEVAHQWFYGLIGDDQLHEPWLDEALATYAEVLYYEKTGRPGAATGLLSDLRSWVRSSSDPTLPIGWGVGEYPDPDAYALFVYGKGALFLDALRGEIGDEAFTKFLRSYFDQERYAFATGEAFQQAAEAACSCDLDEIFDLWVWEGGEIPGI
jgi:aminopeptidase N